MKQTRNTTYLLMALAVACSMTQIHAFGDEAANHKKTSKKPAGNVTGSISRVGGAPETFSPWPKEIDTQFEKNAVLAKVSAKQKVLFHYEYDNYAWGHSESGWYVDGDGNIWSMKKVLHWGYEDDDKHAKGGRKGEAPYFDKAHIENGYKNARGKLLGKIDKKTLDHYSSLIMAASKGTHSAEKHVGNDIGRDIYGCLYYDEKQKTYRKVILLQDGDTRFYNKAPGARTIVEWLMKIPKTKK